MAGVERAMVGRDVKAAKLAMKVVCMYTEHMFVNRATLTESAWEKTMDSGKKILRKSQHEPETRKYLGSSLDVWEGLVMCFARALPVLKEQSFAGSESANAEPIVSSSALMVLNLVNLMKDLERLNDLVTIARNMLASTTRAQNIATDVKFDQEILKLVDICVRVTVRGYDGETSNRAEAQWGTIIGSYKKLLITCLQFLHNLVMHNEHRKLILWLDLFGNSKLPEPYLGGGAASGGPSRAMLSPQTSLQDGEEANTASPCDEPFPVSGTEESHRATENLVLPNDDELQRAMESTALNSMPSDKDMNRVMITSEDLKQAIDILARTGSADEELQALKTIQAARVGVDANKSVNGAVGMTSNQHLTESRVAQDEAQLEDGTNLANRDHMAPQGLDGSLNWPKLPDSTLYSALQSSEVQAEDIAIGRTPESAAETLKEAKEQLMVRLQDPGSYPTIVDGQDYAGQIRNVDRIHQTENGENRGSGAVTDGSIHEEEEEDEDEEDEEEYRGAGDQERGLLTDIPLVLGPQEIEALPMIIQAGIVNFPSRVEGVDVKDAQNMQAVRCNILLAQETGRNLLRELLIFIAAWDLQDDEFYFKLMVQIMEAILQNGLMPFAYQTFGEVKDIVSPAQSIVIKILTQIFRKKQSMAPAQALLRPARQTRSRVDILIVRYIFTVFRQAIIPETCALIYLQGQIRAGAALPQDFPLNLWDMERVYEGVYQFLEFFAVLTESEEWKDLLVGWEIVSELVTLLRELDSSIPKAPIIPQNRNYASNETATEGLGNPSVTAPAPVAVERPYEPVTEFPPADYGTDSIDNSPDQILDNQDPSEFEWRNLKKLVILVLSSLVWKSPVVQRQINKYGGVDMVLSCCNFDANNPYIREHAIMCLRFLLEGSKENQEIVRDLEPKRPIPNEVMDKAGYETFIDDSGKVGLRRKEGTMTAAHI